MTDIDTTNTKSRLLVHPETGDQWRFIWFPDVTIEGGKVLVRRMDKHGNPTGDSAWWERQSARDIWTSLVNRGYERNKQPIEYFEQLLEDCNK